MADVLDLYRQLSDADLRTLADAFRAERRKALDSQSDGSYGSYVPFLDARLAVMDDEWARRAAARAG